MAAKYSSNPNCKSFEPDQMKHLLTRCLLDKHFFCNFFSLSPTIFPVNFRCRAQSIRPSNRGEKHVTPYTRTQRHYYVDPDYAFTFEEERAKKAHKDRYKQFLRECSEKRQCKELNR